MAFELVSSAFKRDEAIPKEHTCDGADTSVPLKWKDPPERTKGFVLIVDDPDAPRALYRVRKADQRIKTDDSR
jgi:phosphatidylethanolamine-binding protein (PEBP) family uncharacterized protein